MNAYMGRWLRARGYPDTRVKGVSWVRRLKWALAYAPYRHGVFPVALRVKWALKYLCGQHGEGPAGVTHSPGETTQ